MEQSIRKTAAADRDTPQTGQASAGTEVKGTPANMAGWPDLITENVRFLSDRVQQNLEAQRAFLACRSADEILHLQTEFHRKAMEQYAAQAERVMRSMLMTTAQVMEKTTTLQARRYDDVPL